MQRVTRHHLIGLDSFSVPSAAVVRPGEEFVVETVRATSVPFLTGPIEVTGLGAGDTLAVTIEQIRTVGRGTIGFAVTREPGEPWGGVLREHARGSFIKEVDVAGGQIHLSSTTAVPVKPMVGWMGLIQPEYEADPWDHGGNMDTTALSAGATLYLHDRLGSGRFLIGDVHA